MEDDIFEKWAALKWIAIHLHSIVPTELIA